MKRASLSHNAALGVRAFNLACYHSFRAGFFCDLADPHMQRDAQMELVQRYVTAQLNRGAIPKLHNGYAMDN